MQISFPVIKQHLHLNFIHAQRISISHSILLKDLECIDLAEMAELNMDLVFV